MKTIKVPSTSLLNVLAPHQTYNMVEESIKNYFGGAAIRLSEPQWKNHEVWFEFEVSSMDKNISSTNKVINAEGSVKLNFIPNGHTDIIKVEKLYTGKVGVNAKWIVKSKDAK